MPSSNIALRRDGGGGLFTFLGLMEACNPIGCGFVGLVSYTGYKVNVNTFLFPDGVSLFGN